MAAGLLGCASPGTADEWTGLHIGIGGGMGAANHDLSFENGPGLPSPPFPGFAAELSGLGGDGGFFSLGVGLDYRVNSRFVVGAFFDYDWADLETSLDASLSLGGPALGAGADIEVEDMWSIGGRLGYLVSPSTMLFMTAGYSQADVSDLTANASGLGSVTLARVGDFDGYFIGGGAEMKITRAISIKGEYRYTDLDSEMITLLPGSGLGDFVNSLVTTKLDPDIQTARVSLNYRFGLGGPSEAEPIEEVSVGSWTQFYLSIGGGYAFTNEELTLSNGPAIVPPLSFNVGFDGFGGKGGALTIGGGYDFQFAPKFVAGLLIDYTMHGADTDFDLNVGNSITANLGFGLDNELSIGGRLGYLVTPQTLIYGSIGYSRIELDDAQLSVNFGGLGGFGTRVASSGAIDGFFLGGGIETKITDNVSLKLDYRYTNGDSEQITLLPDVLPEANNFVRAEIDPDIQTVRMSLDYRFNFGGADPAPLK